MRTKETVRMLATTYRATHLWIFPAIQPAMPSQCLVECDNGSCNESLMCQLVDVGKMVYDIEQARPCQFEYVRDMFRLRNVLRSKL